MLDSRRFLVALLLSGSPAAAQIALEIPEPNDSGATATPVPCLAQCYGNLSPGGDIDWWKFSLSSICDVTAYSTSRGALDSSAGGTSANDTVLDLVAGDGVTVLASNDNYGARPIGQRGFFSKVAAPSLAAGTYFLRIRGWSSIERGDYAIDLVCTPPLPTLIYCGSLRRRPPEVEPNGLASDVGVAGILPCTECNGTVSVNGDEDFWKFKLTDPHRCIFDVVGDPGQSNALFDSQLWLYAADGTTLLAWDEDSGAGFFARLTRDLAAGTYYLKARASGTGTGDYLLDVNCAPIPSVAVLADYAPAGGSGCAGSVGVPLALVPRRNEWPRIASTYTVDVANASFGAVFLLGLLRYQPDLDLGLIGAPGCTLAIQLLYSVPCTPTVTREAEAGFTLPYVLDLGGAAVHLQAAALDPGANVLGVITSSRLTLTLGTDA